MSLHPSSHLQIIFPPQQPIAVKDKLRLFATLYVDDPNAEVFRSMVREGAAAAEFRLMRGSSSASTLFEGDAELTHSFGHNDILLLLPLPALVMEPGPSYVIELACGYPASQVVAHLALRIGSGEI